MPVLQKEMMLKSYCPHLVLITKKSISMLARSDRLSQFDWKTRISSKQSPLERKAGRPAVAFTCSKKTEQLKEFATSIVIAYESTGLIE